MSKELMMKINTLEELIVETEEMIEEGLFMSDYMVEPIKSEFIAVMRAKQLEIDNEKVILKELKGLVD